MNHAQIRAFHAVANEGSFTKAADVLNVTQPTLSGQVAALEEIYGVKLFERRGRGIEITEIGRRLHAVTLRQFAVELEAEQVLLSARGLMSGQLRVAADAPYHVVPLLATFSRLYPGINFSMSFGNSQQVLQGLFERKSDVVVMPNIQEDRRIHAAPLKREPLIVFVDRNHPWSARRSISITELPHHRVILREKGSITRKIFENALESAGVKLGDILEVGSREAIREAVASGLGIGVVFESEFGNDTRLHGLTVRDVQLEGLEYVACLKDKKDSPVIRAFFDQIQSLTASNMA